MILGCNNFNKSNINRKTFAASIFVQILSLNILFKKINTRFEVKLKAALAMLSLTIRLGQAKAQTRASKCGLCASCGSQPQALTCSAFSSPG
jgi:hypothetical protein